MMHNNGDRTVAKISLENLKYNYSEINKKVGNKIKIISVVKANAYGHGAVEISKTLEAFDFIWGFAVSNSKEALELRENGIKKPILILGVVFDDELKVLGENNISLAITSLENAKSYNKIGKELLCNLPIHIALDTGMGRIGYKNTEKDIEEIKEISKLSNIKIEGIFTHFCTCDEKDLAFTDEQLKSFKTIIKALEKEGINVGLKHCANSAGIMRLKNNYFDIVRSGIISYGVYPSDDVPFEELSIKPVLSWTTKVAYVKEINIGDSIGYGRTFIAQSKMRVATIPVGYGDGYPRSLSNKGWVLIHGKKAKILGRICMDQMMVDVTNIADVRYGDKVVLIGKDGKEDITVNTLGDLSGRFPYEFFCDINKRVTRVFS